MHKFTYSFYVFVSNPQLRTQPVVLMSAIHTPTAVPTLTTSADVLKGLVAMELTVKVCIYMYVRTCTYIYVHTHTYMYLQYCKYTYTYSTDQIQGIRQKRLHSCVNAFVSLYKSI